MLITNVNNQYLKLSSDEITALINSPSSYTSIKLVSTVNCGAPTEQTQSSNSFAGNSWGFDFTAAIASGEVIHELLFTNVITGSKFNVITGDIDLSTVNESCPSLYCTLADYVDTYAPQFKIQIDAFFASVGISCDCVIQIVGNTVYLTGIPSGFIPISASYVSSFLATLAFYTDQVTATYDFFLGTDGIYVKPSSFGLTAFEDGIYSLKLKLFKEDSNILESNCIFIDILTKCKVAAYLQDLISEAASTNDDDNATSIHLLHYSLVNGSNCGCNCAEMCTVYNEIKRLLDTSNPQTETDCGC